MTLTLQPTSASCTHRIYNSYYFHTNPITNQNSENSALQLYNLWVQYMLIRFGYKCSDVCMSGDNAEKKNKKTINNFLQAMKLHVFFNSHKP